MPLGVDLSALDLWGGNASQWEHVVGADGGIHSEACGGAHVGTHDGSTW